MSRIEEARRSAADSMRSPGDWLTAQQRCEAWLHARHARDNPINHARKSAISPEAVVEQHPAGDTLSGAAVDVINRVASDPGRLTRSWADRRMSELGSETYTELVGVTAVARVLDCFDEITGRTLNNIESGDSATTPTDARQSPARQRPDDVGDVGAWVHQTVGKKRANVSRALSLVPVTDATWRSLVDSHYSRGTEFMSLRWDRALTRVQIEAVAARTTAELDCFY